MDGKRFDELSKALARGTHRRTFLKILAAGPLAGIAARLGLHETASAGIVTSPTCNHAAMQSGLACCEALFGPRLNSTPIILLNSTVFYPQCVTSVNGRPVHVDTQCEFKLCEYDVLHGKDGKGCQGVCGSCAPTGCSANCGVPGTDCICGSTTEGVNACVEEICTSQICHTSADCPAGSVCFTSGCCGNSEFQGFCIPRCGTGLNRAGRQTAPGAPWPGG